MNRILDLQGMVAYDSDTLEAEASTSSGNHCACSTNSAVACFIADDLVAI